MKGGLCLVLAHRHVTQCWQLDGCPWPELETLSSKRQVPSATKLQPNCTTCRRPTAPVDTCSGTPNIRSCRAFVSVPDIAIPVQLLWRIQSGPRANLMRGTLFNTGETQNLDFDAEPPPTRVTGQTGDVDYKFRKLLAR